MKEGREVVDGEDNSTSKGAHIMARAGEVTCLAHMAGMD